MTVERPAEPPGLAGCCLAFTRAIWSRNVPDVASKAPYCRLTRCGIQPGIIDAKGGSGDTKRPMACASNLTGTRWWITVKFVKRNEKAGREPASGGKSL